MVVRRREIARGTLRADGKNVAVAWLRDASAEKLLAESNDRESFVVSCAFAVLRFDSLPSF